MKQEKYPNGFFDWVAAVSLFILLASCAATIVAVVVAFARGV